MWIPNSWWHFSVIIKLLSSILFFFFKNYYFCVSCHFLASNLFVITMLVVNRYKYKFLRATTSNHLWFTMKLCFYKTIMVWRLVECEPQAWTIHVCICWMRLTNDTIIVDINWCETILSLMIMLIWVDVVIFLIVFVNIYS